MLKSILYIRSLLIYYGVDYLLCLLKINDRCVVSCFVYVGKCHLEMIVSGLLFAINIRSF